MEIIYERLRQVLRQTDQPLEERPKLIQDVSWWIWQRVMIRSVDSLSRAKVVELEQLTRWEPERKIELAVNFFLEHCPDFPRWLDDEVKRYETAWRRERCPRVPEEEKG